MINPAFVKRFNFIQQFNAKLAKSFFHQRSYLLLPLLTQEAFLENLTVGSILSLVKHLSGDNFTYLMQHPVFLAYVDRQGPAARGEFLLLSAKRCSPFAKYIIGNSIIRAWLAPETLKNIARECYEASFLLLRLQQQGAVTLTEQHLSEIEREIFTKLRVSKVHQGLSETDEDIQFLYQTYHTRPEVLQRYSTVWRHLVAEAVQRQLINPEAITLPPCTEEQETSLTFWDELTQLKKEFKEIEESIHKESNNAHWAEDDVGEKQRLSTSLKVAGLGSVALLGVGMIVIGMGVWFAIPLVAQVLLITAGSLLCALTMTGLIFVVASCFLASLSKTAEPSTDEAITPVTTPLLQPKSSYGLFWASQSAQRAHQRLPHTSIACSTCSYTPTPKV